MFSRENTYERLERTKLQMLSTSREHCCLHVPEMRYKAPRSAGGIATLSQEGKIERSGRKKGPFLIVSANWRLESAKSPAAMLKENNTQTPHACHECTAYVCAMYVCLEACDL